MENNIISKNLASMGIAPETVNPATMRNLEKIETFFTEKEKAYSEASETLRRSSINVSAVASAIGRSRTTIHTNQVLMDYIDYRTKELEDANPYAVVERLTEERKQLKEQVSLMEIRDVKAELLRHERDVLQRQIDEQQKEIRKLKDRNRELSAELHNLKVNPPSRPTETAKTILSPAFGKGLEPNNFMLGGSFGSIADFSNAIRQAGKLDTETMMLYVDNADFPIPTTDMLGDFRFVLHAPLNMNIASENAGIRNAALEMMIQIILKCNRFADHIQSMVVHPGNADTDEYLTEVLRKIVPLANFTIALETMSGKGKELGTTFQDLVKIKAKAGNWDNLKFCIDTCHISDSGYDMNNPGLVISEITSIMGIDDVAVLHINDSKNICGSRKDRHANIGEGTIPLASLQTFVQSAVFDGIPKILETPLVDGDYNYQHEMKLLLSERK